MNILEQIRYISSDIKNPIGFRTKYFLEKVVKIPSLILRNIFWMKNIKIPYLFLEDYLLENSRWKWLIKARTDYDYTINPYVENELSVFFNTHGIFLDIGTHIGKWSIYVAKQWNKVFSFEPNIESYGYLKENIKLNNLENYITTINKWVWAVKWILSFSQDKEETSKSKFSQNGNIKVEIISIDDFIKDNNLNIDDIKLIKIDTEWFEFNVFRWMLQLLENTKELKIICEILDNQEDKDDIFTLLKSFGFKSKKLATPADYLFYKSSV